MFTCNSINRFRLVLLVIMLLHHALRLTHELKESVGVVAVRWLPAEFLPPPTNAVAASERITPNVVGFQASPLPPKD